MSLIGLSECDDNRKLRTRFVQSVWNELTKTRGYSQTYPLFRESIYLLMEAASCFQNGAYMGTALLCRSATETAVYSMTTRKVSATYNSMIVTMEIDLNCCEAQWGKILSEAKRTGRVDDKDEAVLNKIREKGAFAAHYLERVDKQDMQFVKTGLLSRLRAKSIWLDEGDAKVVLHETVCLLSRFVKRTHIESRARIGLFKSFAYDLGISLRLL